GDHTIAERPAGHDVSRRSADHLLGFVPHRQDFRIGDAARDDGRLADDDALTSHVDQCVRRPEVDAHIAVEPAQQPVGEHHGSRLSCVKLDAYNAHSRSAVDLTGVPGWGGQAWWTACCYRGINVASNPSLRRVEASCSAVPRSRYPPTQTRYS